ncbi:MAG TPA: ACT domain-containing protein [Nocardioides sp.]|nr:ACT domain-containing protein [Nocardioides sp.]
MTEPTEPTEPTGPAAQTFSIARYPETLAVVRLPAGAEIPEWAESSSIFSITATATETSLVCAGRSVPKKARHEKPFTAFAVNGPLEFDQVGVLVTLLTPLAEAGISILTLSTFDTDWILVRASQADRAEEAWRRSGHTVAPAVPA